MIVVNSTELLTDFLKLRDGIDNGTYARDEKTRALSKILRNMLTILELERDCQRLRLEAHIELIPFFAAVKTPLTENELTMIEQASRVHKEIMKRLAQH